MADHNELGKLGEEFGVRWLEEKGFEILFRNWRFSYHEIDILAVKDNVLHVIEVKSRRSSHYSFPESSVTKRKFRFLKNAVHEFLFQRPHYQWIQYDILSITFFANQQPEILMLEDVTI